MTAQIESIAGVVSVLERGDAFDWEELVDREAAVKRRIAVNELRPGRHSAFLR